MEGTHGFFRLISKADVKDFGGGTALYYRHKSGMDVLHFKCDDKENLFAFAFRTPCMDGKGKPHIIEHSVFCGSEKYPLKEPFTDLMASSVNTYLNAVTYSDMTVYPAASPNSKDYYNLMSVYADAVFFPLLTENAFMQEAHRLELPNGNLKKAAIQGVVYNEMKGSYSSFASVEGDIFTQAMAKGTCYEHNSGGDPKEIPHLTYEEFKAFHKEYYRPDNCILFLYGDEDTEKQLDFVQKEVLDRLEERGLFRCCEGEEIEGEDPVVPENMMKAMTAVPFDGLKEVRTTGPDSDTKGSSVTVNWRITKCGKKRTMLDMMKASFLSTLLMGNEAAPMSKAIVESNLGDRLLCSLNNCSSDLVMYFGTGGVAKGNEEKVKSLVFDTLKGLVEKGFSKEQIETAVLSIDFSIREKKRPDDSPMSLMIMENAVGFWAHGSNPAYAVGRIDEFEAFKKRMRESGDESAFCVSLLKEMITCNKDCAFIVITPKAAYMKDRAKEEAKLTAAIEAKADKKALQKRLCDLHEAQSRKESESEKACLPRLTVADLESEVQPIKVEISTMNGAPLLLSRAATDGIIYFSMHFPCDTLPAADLPYLPFLSDCLFYTGAKGMKWNECVEKMALCSGGVYSMPMTGNVETSEDAVRFIESVKQYNFIGRDWFNVGIKFTAEKLNEALPLFMGLLPVLDFSDEARLKTLILHEYDSIRSSVIPCGSQMAKMRCKCRLNTSSALSEVWSGLTQLFTMNRLVKTPPKEAGETLSGILNRLLCSGALFNITADDESMEKTLKLLPSLANEGKALSPRPLVNADDIYRLTLLPGETLDMRNVAYTLKSQVSFAARGWQVGKMDFDRDGASEALCQWMNSNILWETMRTKGGAYGAGIGADSTTGIASFITYRDPAPYRSLDALKDCLKAAKEMRFTEKEAASLITGCYSRYVEPLTPSRYGSKGLCNTLYALTDADRTRYLRSLLAITGDMLHNEAERFYRALDEGGCTSAVLGSAKAGDIFCKIELPC